MRKKSRNSRNAVLIEANPAYIELIRKRCAQPSLPLEGDAA